MTKPKPRVQSRNHKLTTAEDNCVSVSEYHVITVIGAEYHKRIPQRQGVSILFSPKATYLNPRATHSTGDISQHMIRKVALALWQWFSNCGACTTSGTWASTQGHPQF